MSLNYNINELKNTYTSLVLLYNDFLTSINMINSILSDYDKKYSNIISNDNYHSLIKKYRDKYNNSIEYIKIIDKYKYYLEEKINELERISVN